MAVTHAVTVLLAHCSQKPVVNTGQLGWLPGMRRNGSPTYYRLNVSPQNTLTPVPQCDALGGD